MGFDYARHGRGNEQQPIFRDRIECRGNENNISECPIVPVSFGGYCTHSDDASVTCGEGER